MGQTNSVNSLIKVAESIATIGLKPINGINESDATVSLSREDWDYYVEYKRNNGPFNIVNKKPRPTNTDNSLNTRFIIKPENVDDSHLKLVTKTEVTGAIYSFQKDEQFTKWLKNVNDNVISYYELGGSDEYDNIINVKTIILSIKTVDDWNDKTDDIKKDILKTLSYGKLYRDIFDQYNLIISNTDDFDNQIKILKSLVSSIDFKQEISPVDLANTINAIIETHLSSSKIYEYVGNIYKYNNISTLAISLNDIDYPADLFDYAKRSVEHAYVANIAGLLISILDDSNYTKFISKELYESGNSNRKLDSLIMLLVIAILIAVIIVGGYSIFTVIANEAHHVSAYY